MHKGKPKNCKIKVKLRGFKPIQNIDTFNFVFEDPKCIILFICTKRQGNLAFLTDSLNNDKHKN